MNTVALKRKAFVILCFCLDLWNVISNSPITVPVQSPLLVKYGPNDWKCPCSTRFMEDTLVACVDIGQPSIPDNISSQPVEILNQAQSH